MEWEKLDWAALDRLREGFLTGSAARGPYWRTLKDLEAYDLTYGERIGWKWDAVIRELQLRAWTPFSSTAPGAQERTLVDWGCGSGIAGRRVLAAFDADQVSTLLVHDHSPLAREFALASAKRHFPHLVVGELRADSPVDVLVISHVLNELSADARRELLGLIARARAVIWVEPGTHAVSRDLIQLREGLRTDFRLIAPCTHRAQCGLLAPHRTGDWCHHFAPPPTGIYADSDWVKFGQRAGIDLRSLPYSFLVLERADPHAASATEATGSAAEERIIGEPRHYKGYAKLLSCGVAGVEELTLQKRDDAALFKALKRESGVPVYRWTRDADRIKSGERAYGPSENASQ